ncbi:MAG: tetratricopeptide repeat protein [Bryobacteraceae bacterium]
MRAFLSHSSIDKGIVVAVHERLEPDSTWLDRAEIEWGDMFLEKITEGIESATDFVLFWSASAAQSEWVRLEVNMVFIQALRSKAIRLRVVLLDATPLPLHLNVYQSFSVIGSATPADHIVQKLTPLLREPIRSARARFVNRHDEVARLESAVDDPSIHTAWVFGFTGVGKTSLIHEALKRIFEGVETIRIDLGQGTGFVELALELCALVRHEALAVGLSQADLESDIRLSIELLAQSGRLLVLSNIQHWLGEDGEPVGPLPFLLAMARGLRPFEKRPLFLTSTRRPNLAASDLNGLTIFNLQGLQEEHVATLIRNWHYLIYDRDLDPKDAKRIAPKLYGHPVAARLVAGLLGSHSVDFLEKYPQELISLRRDLARVLLQDIQLSPAAEKLMEMLALAGVALPASVIVATGFSDDEFQQAVAQCASAGLITAELSIETHPLFREFFWHRLHRTDYRGFAMQLAEVLKVHFEKMDKTSAEYAELLLVAYRSYALAGDIQKANALRDDLSGELEATAITLYNRRSYDLADQYIQHLLDHNPSNWRMRLYRARIRIRQENWEEASAILKRMSEERPDDIGIIHATGWLHLRRRQFPQALEFFTRVISRREHVASLRDAAECLQRLDRSAEALKLLSRAKQQESENPFVLDLESRILEDLGELEPAYESAFLAAARDPLNAFMHNRLGVIRTKQHRPDLAIPHFQRAIELDNDLFSPANSLASAFVDTGDVDSAEKALNDLRAKARTPSDRSLLRHTEAHVAFARKHYEESRDILKHEITLFHNVIPNLGLLVRVECALFDQNARQFPTIAATCLTAADAALARIVALEKDNEFIGPLQAQTDERKNKPKGLGALPIAKPLPPANPQTKASAPLTATPKTMAPTPESEKKPAPKQPLRPPLIPPRKPFSR